MAAITSSAAASSTKIALRTSSASPSTTTGTPETTYFAPRSGCSVLAAVTSLIRSIARPRSASVRSGLRRTWISAAFSLGNRYEKRDLGTPTLPCRAPSRVSNTSVETKSGESIDGSPVRP